MLHSYVAKPAKSGGRPKRRGWRSRLTVMLALVLLAAGGYIFWLSMGTEVYIPEKPQTWNQPVPKTVDALTIDQLYVPKLKLVLPFKSGDQRVLRDNAWHRFPERGDPENGGNFILAGHRFEIGLTPGETKRRSPFYHIGLLKTGDKIYADFKGKRYAYEVSEINTVKPNQVEIEAPSETPKMTLYTCTLGGSNDGRVVIVAKPTGRDIDPRKPLEE